jgi:hypothetical protein
VKRLGCHLVVGAAFLALALLPLAPLARAGELEWCETDPKLTIHAADGRNYRLSIFYGAALSRRELQAAERAAGKPGYLAYAQPDGRPAAIVTIPALAVPYTVRVVNRETGTAYGAGEVSPAGQPVRVSLVLTR